jgi:hypothetical protein
MLDDKAQVRSGPWRRLSPGERADMWRLGAAEDHVAYSQFIAQSLDRPDPVEAIAAGLPRTAVLALVAVRAAADAA